MARKPNSKAETLTADQALGQNGYRGCGVGLGRICCAYLTAGPNGFECEQWTVLGQELARRASGGGMGARRLPKSEFPNCQTEGRK